MQLVHSGSQTPLEPGACVGEDEKRQRHRPRTAPWIVAMPVRAIVSQASLQAPWRLVHWRSIGTRIGPSSDALLHRRAWSHRKRHRARADAMRPRIHACHVPHTRAAAAPQPTELSREPLSGDHATTRGPPPPTGGFGDQRRPDAPAMVIWQAERNGRKQGGEEKRHQVEREMASTGIAVVGLPSE